MSEKIHHQLPEERIILFHQRTLQKRRSTFGSSAKEQNMTVTSPPASISRPVRLLLPG
jgi:hypothetical protein